MGMFDWYEPRPAIICPRCGAALSGWQGKCGPCALFEWVQGLAWPARQLVDDECAASDLVRSATRLPDEFDVYTSCNACKVWVEALGSCDQGIWTRVDLLHPLEPPGLPEEWMPVRGDDALGVAAELRREIPTGHVLFARNLFPVGRRRDRDDVLLKTIGPEGKLWVVHLTWRTETDPRWPSARSFRDVAEFVAQYE